MDLDELIEGVEGGKYTATLFTQENCDWCEKMKASIIELKIPANEVVTDRKMVDTFELDVTPTLMITSKSELTRIRGFMSSEDLLKSIQDIN